MGICQRANERNLASLATVEVATPLGQLTEKLCQPAIWQGRRVRALNPFNSDDLRLLAAVCRGEFSLQGFRNGDLRPLLFPPAATPAESRRQSAAVSRRLRMLRAHGLIAKIPKTHRYQITAQGRTALVALLHAHQANTAQLSRLAA